MNDAITIVPRTVDESKTLSIELAKSALIPSALRKKPEDVLAIVLTGAELGLAPMQALRGIHIIEGKPCLSADAMGALCLSRPEVCEELTVVESTPLIATYRAKRKGKEAVTLSFTMAQAEAAKVTGKDNWRKYPDAMLRARALAAICRAVFPDLCLGLYDGEELETARDVTPAAQQTDALKAQIAAAVKGDVIEGVVVKAEPAFTQVTVADLKEAIALARDLADLKGLIPELQKLPEADQAVLKPIYQARKAALA